MEELDCSPEQQAPQSRRTLSFSASSKRPTTNRVFIKKPTSNFVYSMKGWNAEHVSKNQFEEKVEGEEEEEAGDWSREDATHKRFDRKIIL